MSLQTAILIIVAATISIAAGVIGAFTLLDGYEARRDARRRNQAHRL